MIIILEEW